MFQLNRKYYYVVICVKFSLTNKKIKYWALHLQRNEYSILQNKYATQKQIYFYLAGCYYCCREYLYAQLIDLCLAHFT